MSQGREGRSCTERSTRLPGPASPATAAQTRDVSIRSNPVISVPPVFKVPVSPVFEQPCGADTHPSRIMNTRDEIRPALLEDSVRDLRHGARLLRRAPGFSAAALATLALGIGATSAIFSVVRTVMLEPLPYHEPDRIVTVWETNRGGTQRNVIAPANFVAWRERSRTLDHLGMVGPSSMAMMVDGQPLDVGGLSISSDVFRALGVQPAFGRATRPKRITGTRSSCSATNSGNGALAAARTCSTWQSPRMRGPGRSSA